MAMKPNFLANFIDGDIQQFNAISLTELIQ